MSLDLHPYGIQLTLTSAMKELPLQRGTALLTAAALETKDNITIDGVVYKIDGPSLGQGSYGKTYKCIGPDGKPVAIKAIHQAINRPDDVHSFLTEIIIQIILMETSKDQPGGPYVPKIYKVGFNQAKRNGYIVSELMYRTVRSLIRDEVPAKNDIIIPEMVRQIATILDFFGKAVEFNHRDCKADNLMYVKDADGKRIYKLIDFGYSCLKWNNLELRGKIEKLSGACYRKGRDLSQLLYELTLYHTISSELRDWLESNLRVHIDKVCSIQKCDLPVPVRDWQNTYTLFNAKDIEPVYNTPEVIKRVKQLQEKAGFKTIQADKKIPQEKIVVRVKDHKTNQLIRSYAIKPKTPFKTVFAQVTTAPIAIFKYNGTVVKPTDTPFDLDMKSPVDITVARYEDQKELNADQAAAVKQACPPGKVINPKTGRCVKVDGAAGKAALREAPAPAPAALQAKTCPPGKVLNPKTLRCVKADGWAGKHIKGKTRKNK